MLVLARKVGESIKVADDIEITVLAVENGRVRLGIRAPRNVNVRRSTPEEVGAANREAAVQADPAEAQSLLSQAAAVKSKQG